MKRKLDKYTIRLIVMISIINLVIGTLLSSSISYAISGYTSKEVTFNPSNSNWKVSNVDGALSSLYAMVGAQGVLPVGTISSIMGNSAPDNFLKCDGTVYNISDYRELANYFKNQFGQSNKFGGDGVTTFAVPDLRGEFLRGTGTNTHANQGSGANVGAHQDATGIPYSYSYINNDQTIGGFATRSSSDARDEYNTPSNFDGSLSGTKVAKYVYYQGTVLDSTSNKSYKYYSRPTNTSVLYVIATKDIYMEGKVNYSTEEKLIGTWIDGKPLYQKVYKTTAPNAANVNTAVQSIADIPFDTIFIAGGFLDNGGYAYPLSVVIKDLGDSSSVWVRKEEKTLAMTVSSGRVNKDVYIIVQYTKTTD